jgi:hypothetical protein
MDLGYYVLGRNGAFGTVSVTMLQSTLSPVRARVAAASSHIGYPLWFPLAVYAIARLVDLVFILIAARHQIALPNGATALPGYNAWEASPASPGYGTVASNWDGQWYLSIATNGALQT